MDQVVNSIRLTRKLTHMLKTYKTYNLKMKNLKYEFNNKLLSEIILFKVILVVT